jgi:HSP20 family molecular chaperone IbpA
VARLSLIIPVKLDIKKLTGEIHMNKKYYVSMTDKFLSGWGQARGKNAVFINICDNYEEAQVVADNAGARKDQCNIKISETMPVFNTDRNLVQIKTREDMPNWYKKDYFKKDK